MNINRSCILRKLDAHFLVFAETHWGMLLDVVGDLLASSIGDPLGNAQRVLEKLLATPNSKGRHFRKCTNKNGYPLGTFPLMSTVVFMAALR
jgi:hypothetical protein